MAGQTISSRQAPLRGRIFHGWWIVGSGFLIMLYTTGVGFYGFSAFVNPIADSIAGGSRAAVAGAISIQRAESGLLSPIMGFLVDRIGPRVVLIAGFVIGGAGFILVSLTENLFQFYAAYFLLALGLGAGSFLVVSTAVTNWFVRKRGRALGVLFLGPGFAGLIVTGIVALIDLYDWRVALQFVGVGMWVFCIPLSLVMRKTPEEYGLLPDGDLPPEEVETAAPTDGTAPAAPPAQQADVTIPLGDVLRSRAYYQYVLALSLSQMGFSALVIFQVPAFITFGLSTAEAGLAVLIWTIGGIPGRIASGFLSDAIDKRLVLGAAMALQFIGIFFFITTSDLMGAAMYGVVHGIGWGMTTPSRLSLQGEYWGRSIFGRLMGLQTGLSAAGSILSPLFVGWMFDRTGDYKLAMVLLFLPLLFCIVLVLTLKRPVPQTAAPTPAPASAPPA